MVQQKKKRRQMKICVKLIKKYIDAKIKELINKFSNGYLMYNEQMMIDNYTKDVDNLIKNINVINELIEYISNSNIIIYDEEEIDEILLYLHFSFFDQLHTRFPPSNELSGRIISDITII